VWLHGDKRKKGKNGIIEDSLLDVFEAEKGVQVPKISESNEVKIATKKHLSIS
jgi:hypothetical protein